MFRVTFNPRNKVCRKCNILLAEENSWIDTIKMRNYTCRSCWTLEKKKWTKKYPDKARLSHRLGMRKWRNNIANAKKENERNKKYYPKYAQRIKEYNKKIRIEHSEVIKARAMVSNFLHAKKIEKKPCRVCGTGRSQAHHSDYLKPLEIIWLCPKHHKQLHQNILQLP